MSAPAIIEAPEISPSMREQGAEFTNRVKAEMEKGNPPVEKPPVAKEPEKKAPEAVPEAKVANLLDGFNSHKKKTEVKTDEAPSVEGKEAHSDKEQNLGILRKRAEAAEARAKELESKVPEDYEPLKQRLAKREEEFNLVVSELKKTNLAAVPEFKAKYDNKINASIATIEKVLKTAEVDPTEFASIVKLPESKQRAQKIAEMVSELDEFSKARVTNAVAEHDSIREAREQELSNPDPTLIQFTQQAKERQEQNQARLMAIIDDEISNAEKAIPWLVESEDAGPEWNAEIKGIKDGGRRLWRDPNVSAQEQARAALAAAMTPTLMKLLNSANTELERVNAELAKARGSSPATGARKSESTPLAPSKNGDANAFMDAFNKARGN